MEVVLPEKSMYLQLRVIFLIETMGCKTIKLRGTLVSNYSAQGVPKCLYDIPNIHVSQLPTCLHKPTIQIAGTNMPTVAGMTWSDYIFAKKTPWYLLAPPWSPLSFTVVPADFAVGKTGVVESADL